MVFSKFLALALAASTATDSDGFVVVSPPTITSSRPLIKLGATHDADDERAATSENTIRNLVAASAITLGLLFPSSGAFATVPLQATLNDHAVLSSTFDLSKAITTMDFSLPSSYDKISDPVASGKDELTTTVVVETGSSKRSSASLESSSSKKKSAPKPSSGGGLSFNKMISLPSSPSSGSSMKEEAAAALAERIAQRKSMEAEQAARDEQAARERDANIKAAREEKIARRAAEQAEKEAAALAKEEEAKYKGVKFVDTSMPEY